jgi:hypothetical protein
MSIGNGGNYDDQVVEIIKEVCIRTYSSPSIVSKLFTQFKANNFGILDEMMNCIASSVFPLAAVLNHSCNPNSILSYCIGTNYPIVKVVACRDISIGDDYSFLD